MSTSIVTVSTTPAHDNAGSGSNEPDEPGSSPWRGAEKNSSSPASDEPPPAEPSSQHADIDLIGAPMLRAHVDSVDQWTSTLRALLHHLDLDESLADAPRVSRLGIRFVDDAAMSRFHVQFSGVEGTTDVLTFDASESSDSAEVDLIVCVDVAAREARQRQHSVGEELLLYTLHGVLHCLGHDDHTDHEYQAMHDAEDRILSAAGINARFADHNNEAGKEDSSL